MPSLTAQARLEAALPAALVRITATPSVYAVLWCGSAARGEADAHSDLDFHVLVTGDRRWRSSLVVDGVPVEVFHNPARKIWALFEKEEAATVAMFAQGRVLVPHPELDTLIAEARRLYAAGPTSRPLTPAERYLLIDEVVEARSALGEAVHPYVVASATGQLVSTVYRTAGWWEVKPRHWLRDLRQRDSDAASLLQATLNAIRPAERQAALEAFAIHALNTLDYEESATEPQEV